MQTKVDSTLREFWWFTPLHTSDKAIGRILVPVEIEGSK